MQWFNKKMFDTENPDDDARPVLCSSSLEFWKKALLAYMPNRLMVWNEISRIGNPTRSTAINMLIKRIKKSEVQKQGAKSRARQSITDNEFCKMNLLARRCPEGQGSIWKYGIPAQLCYQFHLIAGLDDTMMALRKNLAIHPHFNFALKTKLNWSKNVREERDAPWQIILGSMDGMYCVLISLAVWLEVFFSEYNYCDDSPYLFAFLSDCYFPEGGKSGKQVACRIFANRAHEEAGLVGAMEDEEGGGIGTHSIRKYASSHSRKQGKSKDDRDHQARWKGKKRVADAYDDVELPFVDTNVAALLCIGGPCKYVVADKDVTDNFLLSDCVPNM